MFGALRKHSFREIFRELALQRKCKVVEWYLMVDTCSCVFNQGQEDVRYNPMNFGYRRF
ncbi:MAG: hypothetical protein DID89_2727546815 [Candidatus Nitrotoga sp. CP45]|nr:MAG: hypothetical protein DID89_2727546815 [Candidatus Nitrotoga sp. CP45]